MTPLLFHISGILLATAADSANRSDSLVIDPAPTPREARLDLREVVARSRPESRNHRTIGREELSRAANLVDLLDREPGVQGRRAGGLGNYATLSMRGSASDQVEVWMDGIPLGGSAGSTVDLGPVSLDGLERVEIRQAGQSGSGGAPRLDLTSRRGWAHQGASLRAGSFGERAMSAWWGDSSGRTAVSGWYESAENDYPFPWDNGTVYNKADDRTVRLSNNDYRGRGLSFALRPIETLDLSLRAEDSRRGVAVAGDDEADGRLEHRAVQGNLRWQGLQDWHPRLEGGARWRNSEWNDPGRATDWRVDHRSTETAMDLSAQTGVSRESGEWLDGWLLARLRWESSERRSLGEANVPVTPAADRRTWEAELGWKGASPGASFGAEASIRTQSFVDGRDWTSGIGTLEVGDRIETEREGLRASARIWTRPVEAVSLWMSAAHRVRAPDFQEWMGDNGYTLATPGLGPETAEAFEFGGEWRPAPPWRANATLWLTDYQDPIESYQVGTSPLVYHRNAPGYRAWGLDTRASWCGEFTGLSLGATIQDAAIEDPNPTMDGNRPRRFPLWRSDLQASLGPWRNFVVGAGATAQGSTYASELERSSDRRPGRLFLESWVRWARSGISASLSLRNLLDEHPEDFEDLPLSGRQVSLRLELDLPNPKHPSGESR